MTTSAAIAALGTKLYVGDSGGAGVQASKTIGTVNQQLRVKAKVGGTGGNSKTFGIVVSGLNTVYSQVITANSVLINSATDGAGAATTTVAAAIIALYADATFQANFYADGSSGTASGLLVAGASSALSGGSGGELFTIIGGVVGLDGPQFQKQFADATHLNSTNGVMESVPTITDPGTIAFPLQLVPSDTQHRAIQADLLAGTRRNFQLLFSDIGGSRLDFAGYFAQFSITSQFNDIYKAQMSIRITAAPSWGV